MVDKLALYLDTTKFYHLLLVQFCVTLEMEEAQLMINSCFPRSVKNSPQLCPVHRAALGGVAQFQANQEGEWSVRISRCTWSHAYIPWLFWERNDTCHLMRGASPALQMWSLPVTWHDRGWLCRLCISASAAKRKLSSRGRTRWNQNHRTMFLPAWRHSHLTQHQLLSTWLWDIYLA